MKISWHWHQELNFLCWKRIKTANCPWMLFRGLFLTSTVSEREAGFFHLEYLATGWHKVIPLQNMKLNRNLPMVNRYKTGMVRVIAIHLWKIELHTHTEKKTAVYYHKNWRQKSWLIVEMFTNSNRNRKTRAVSLSSYNFQSNKHPVDLSNYVFIKISTYLSLKIFYLFIYLPIYLSVYLTIYQSMYLSIHLLVYLSIYMSNYLSVFSTFYLSVCLTVYLFNYQSFYQSNSLALYQPIFLSTYPPIRHSIILSI